MAHQVLGETLALGAALRASLPIVLSAALLACGGGGGGDGGGTQPTPCTDGQTAPCYDGPQGTQGVGVCHGGTRTCAGGAFGPCVGQKLPSAETCNGLDDDCDGVVDNGAGATCSSRVCSGGACQAPTCSDGVKNQDETDVDCGGTKCAPCANSLGCALDRDCQSAMCFASVCRASLNGCTPGAATDLTAQASVTIGFPVSLTTPAYDRPCVKVKSGTSVTFSGDFPFHPLQGGAIFAATPVNATSGPYAALTNTGTTRTDALSTGNYPYYCTNHGVLFGMAGTIFVVP